VTQQNYYSSGAIPASAPEIAVRAPEDEHVTDYDQRHFLTYARLIDADAGGFDWRESAAAILGLDVERDDLTVRACWDSHLARARWIATTGYQVLLTEARLTDGE
jgi:hypothetical protein